MKIDDQQLQKQVREHDRMRQRVLKSNEAEMEQLKKTHQGQLEITRKDNESRVFDEQLKYRSQMGQVAEENQAKMLDLQKRLDEEKKFYELEQLGLEGQTQDARRQHEYKMQQEYQTKTDAITQQLAQMDATAQAAIHREQSTSEQNLANTQTRNQTELSKAIVDGDRRIAALENRYKQLESGRGKERAQELSQTEKNHQQKLLQQKIKFEREMMQMLKSQEKQMTTSQTLHLAQLEQEKASFDNKYKQLLDNHHAAISRVQVQSQNEVNMMARENTTLKENFALKSHDPFYQPKILSPEILDQGDHYVVSIEIPEHEKENVQVNVDKRNITVQVSRQFKQTIDLPGMNTNKSARSEIFAQTLKTADIMEGNSIKQVYRDGKLHFSINKA